MAAVIVVGMAVVVFGHKIIHAAATLSFSQFAVHPYASKTGYDSTSVNYYNGQKLCSIDWCPTGETLSDMNITSDGKIIAGYGDWNSNVDNFGVAAGGIYVAPIDATTGQ